MWSHGIVILLGERAALRTAGGAASALDPPVALPAMLCRAIKTVRLDFARQVTFVPCTDNSRLSGTATGVAVRNTVLIDSVTELELAAAAWPVFDIAASAIFYPFHYTDDDWIDLRGLAIQQYPDPAGQLRGCLETAIGRQAAP